MGGDLPKARPLIEALPGRATMEALETEGQIELDVDGAIYRLTSEDLLVEEIPAEGYSVESSGELKLALVTTLTEELIEEGLVREIVSKIQTMRRTQDFQVTDRIQLYVKRDETQPLLDRNADAIMSDVLADQMIYFDEGDDLPSGLKPQTWDINGRQMVFAVRVP